MRRNIELLLKRKLNVQSINKISKNNIVQPHRNYGFLSSVLLLLDRLSEECVSYTYTKDVKCVYVLHLSILELSSIDFHAIINNATSHTIAFEGRTHSEKNKYREPTIICCHPTMCYCISASLQLIQFHKHAILMYLCILVRK